MTVELHVGDTVRLTRTKAELGLFGGVRTRTLVITGTVTAVHTDRGGVDGHVVGKDQDGATIDMALWLGVGRVPGSCVVQVVERVG